MAAETSGFGPRRNALVDLALAASALAAWHIRFGTFGPNFNSDAALHGAMVLRPIDASFVYYWGQGRLGSVVPLVGKILHAFPGVGAVESAQLGTYLCSAVGLLLALGLLRTLPAKLMFFALLAFPPDNLAGAFLTAGQHASGVFLFSMLEIRALLRALRNPTAANGVWLGLAAGGLLWAGEPGLFLLVGQIPLLVLHVRATPRDATMSIARGGLAGLVPPAVLIGIGKWHRSETVNYRRMLHPEEIWHSVLGLGPSLRPLASAFGAAGLALFAAGAAVLTLLALRRWRRKGGPPPLLGTVGFSPVIGFVGVASSRWFELNERATRYLGYPTLLALLCLALVIDALGSPERPRWLSRSTAVAALAIALICSTVSLRAGDANAAAGPRWVARTRWIENVGCRSVIADYWESYPYYTLSEGRVLATPCETQYVRNPELAREAARAPLVCVLPWWPTAGDCPQTLEQFGVTLRFQDELIGHVSVGPRPDDQPLRVCRYVPVS